MAVALNFFRSRGAGIARKRNLVAVPPPAPVPTPARPAGRLLYLDGLRALAALAVALFHYRSYVISLAERLPYLVDTVIRYGYLGVNVFFVLSGFVIAHSLGNARYSLSFLGRFVLRRQVRLAPPYWATVVLAAFWLSRDPVIFHQRVSVAGVIAHLGYMQGILGYPHLLDIFWTLCIEVQMYAAYVIFAWIGQSSSSSESGTPNTLRRELVFAATTLGSLAFAWAPISTRMGSLFPFYWYMFAIGAWVRWALDGGRARWWLLFFLPLGIVRSVMLHGPGPIVCVATACLLYVAPRLSWVTRFLGSKPLAYLGKISYSFYLLHALIGCSILHVINHLGIHSIALDIFGVLIALIASIIGSHILWWGVERPSISWSRYFAPQKNKPRTAPSEVTATSASQSTVAA